jgi:RNA polymerase-interacting CarD/CdnL/TRCF family regulator
MSLLKTVVSGNFDENNDSTGVSSLVKNISTKVQNKISSGELDENKLYEEAKTVMNKFGKLAGKGKGKNNPMASVLNTMMKHAEKGQEMSEEDLMNMAKNMMPKNMAGLMTRKDRLKKKLEEKKKQKK